MLIDSFFYNGEEDLLEIRLETLNPIIDKFVLLESPKSHSQIPRELEYPKQQKRFEKFKNKICYFATDYCINKLALANDWIGRDAMANLLIEKLRIGTKTIILSGDLDEIPSPNKIKDIIDNDEEMSRPYTLMMDNRILCFDLEPINQPGKFPGTMILKGKHLQSNRLCWLRQIRQNPTIEGIKYNDFNIIKDSGFHFSYCAGINRTMDKFRFYSHHNETNNWIKDRDGLINCIRNKTSFTPDGGDLQKIQWEEENFPKFIFDNPDKFKEQLSWNYI